MTQRKTIGEALKQGVLVATLTDIELGETVEVPKATSAKDALRDYLELGARVQEHTAREKLESFRQESKP